MEYMVSFTWTAGKNIKIKASSFAEVQKKASDMAIDLLEDQETSEVEYNVVDEEGSEFSGWEYG